MQFGQERRAVERRSLRRGALIDISGLRTLCSCGVQDFSRHGARLRLDGIVLLPTEFSLMLICLDSTHPCRLIWRDGDAAGVAFRTEVPIAAGLA